MGTAQDVTAGKRDPPIDSEVGEEMTDAALDAMRLQECAQAWEDLNREDPKRDKAIENCEKAIKLLAEVETLLVNAAELFDGTLTGMHLMDAMRATESIECDIQREVKKMKGWE